jgi:hypothetical protein
VKIVVGPGVQASILSSDGTPCPLLIRKFSFECEAGAFPTMELSLEVYSKDQAFELEILNFDLAKELGDKLQSVTHTNNAPEKINYKAEKLVDDPALPPEAILDQFKL